MKNTPTSKHAFTMQAVDLFSCIGSHALGLRMAGISVHHLVEIDPQRRSLLQYHFPDIPVHDDVKTFYPRARADLLVGGPPCQAVSVGAAIHGYRNGETLWPEMRRIARELAAEWIIVEQPPGHAAWQAQVRDDLATDHFHSAIVEFGACDLGAPHIRRRVFILANSSFQRLAFAWQEIPYQVEAIKRATAAGNHWLQGPPGTLRVVDGVSSWLDRNAAVKAIGDSNPPQMMMAIGRSIMAAQFSVPLTTTKGGRKGGTGGK